MFTDYINASDMVNHHKLRMVLENKKLSPFNRSYSKNVQRHKYVYSTHEGMSQ